MRAWPICGPKLSLCCSVISVWGIIQFILLGIFFYIQSAPLLDDFSLPEEVQTGNISRFTKELADAFHVRAINCWIAAGLYVALLIFAGIQFRTHLQTSSKANIQTSVTSPFAGVTTEGNGYNSQHGVQFNNDRDD